MLKSTAGDRKTWLSLGNVNKGKRFWGYKASCDTKIREFFHS